MCNKLPCLPEGTEIVADFPNTLEWYEYVIFVAVLVLSMAIGVYELSLKNTKHWHWNNLFIL